MKIRLDASPDTTITVSQDDEGNVLSVEFEPTFTTRKSDAALAYGTTVGDQGGVLDQFALTVAGDTGKVTAKNRSKKVKAYADLTDAEKKALEDDKAEK